MSFLDRLDELARRPVLKAPSHPQPKIAGKMSPEEVVSVLRRNLDANVYGQHRLKTVVLATLAGRLDTLIVSPPGEAKTLSIDVVAESVDAPYYSRLMTSDTTSFDVIGYPLTREVQEGNVRRIEVDIDPDTGALNARHYHAENPIEGNLPAWLDWVRSVGGAYVSIVLDMANDYNPDVGMYLALRGAISGEGVEAEEILLTGVGDQDFVEKVLDRAMKLEDSGFRPQWSLR